MIPQFEKAVSYFKAVILDDLGVYCWVAGGAVRDYFSIGRTTSDIDVFFPDRLTFDIAVETMKRKAGEPTFNDGRVVNFNFKGHTIQLISSHFFKDPTKTIEAFDFTVACAAVDHEKVYHHPTFFMDLASKKLVINKLPYPLSTLQRVQKYVKKGYTICNGGLLELSKAIQGVNLQDSSQNVFEFYPDGTPKFVRFD